MVEMKKIVKALGTKFGEKGKEALPKTLGRFKMGGEGQSGKSKKIIHKTSSRTNSSGKK